MLGNLTALGFEPNLNWKAQLQFSRREQASFYFRLVLTLGQRLTSANSFLSCEFSMVMLIAFLSMVDKESGLALLRRVVLASFPPSGDHSFVTLKRRFSCSSDERCKYSTTVRQGTCTRRHLTLISSNQCFQGRNQKKLWLRRCPWLNFLPRYLVLLNFPPPKKRTKTKTCGKFPYWPRTRYGTVFID